MSEAKRIIEINGVKMEVDLRQAKVIDSYRVGKSVKVLKKDYGDNYSVYPGVIIGFTEFKSLPTIELLYVNRHGEVLFGNLNPKTTDLEIAPINDYEAAFDFESIVASLDRNIEKAEIDLKVMKAKKTAFVENYGKVVEGAKE